MGAVVAAAVVVVATVAMENRCLWPSSMVSPFDKWMHALSLIQLFFTLAAQPVAHKGISVTRTHKVGDQLVLR